MKIRPLEGMIYLLLRFMAGRDGRDRSLKALHKGSVKNILIISSTAIGDTLMSTPAIRAVRKCFPEASLTALLNRDNMELFRDNPHINGVVPYYGGWKRFFHTVAELKKYSFDAALILHGNEPQATPMAYLTGARFIIKLPNVSRFSFLLSNRTPELSWEDLGHGIEARLQAASLAGCEADGLEMELPLDKGYDEAVTAFMEKEGLVGQEGEETILVGFNPGASTLSRMWFPERFIELAGRLAAEVPNLKIVLTGSPQEAPLCAEIANGLSDKTGQKAVVTANKLSLSESAAIIDKFSAFVTGDTGPMHIAYALKTPVVALYAVSEPEKTGPLTERGLHRIIKKQRTCAPCLSKKCTYQECMEQITVDEVFYALMDILETQGQRK
ncbi:MAG: glycosyltransferase family 9 protein [Thermodesulfobacteriota bacterium]